MVRIYGLVEGMSVYLGAEALTRAIDRISDPETGGPVVALSIDPVSRFTKGLPKDAGKTTPGYVVRFR